GVEWRVDGHDEAALTADEQARVARIGAALDEVGERFPGVVIEHKPAGHGVHTRRVSAEVAAEANAAASTAAHEADADVLERGGKDIVEFAVRHVTKGDAIARLRDLHGAD
ncbi:trehalose-phosphatase, partial [Bacillus toyonensis]|uniref:trehalose-phosphatase n=1 Tax=Bacillus toyonensis TaxID=155322 RepID=UPI000BFACDEE